MFSRLKRFGKGWLLNEFIQKMLNGRNTRRMTPLFFFQCLITLAPWLFIQDKNQVWWFNDRPSFRCCYSSHFFVNYICSICCRCTQGGIFWFRDMNTLEVEIPLDTTLKLLLLRWREVNMHSLFHPVQLLLQLWLAFYLMAAIWSLLMMFMVGLIAILPKSWVHMVSMWPLSTWRILIIWNQLSDPTPR